MKNENKIFRVDEEDTLDPNDKSPGDRGSQTNDPYEGQEFLDDDDATAERGKSNVDDDIIDDDISDDDTDDDDDDESLI